MKEATFLYHPTVRHLALARPMDGREMLTWDEHWFTSLIFYLFCLSLPLPSLPTETLRMLLFSSPVYQMAWFVSPLHQLPCKVAFLVRVSGTSTNSILMANCSLPSCFPPFELSPLLSYGFGTDENQALIVF